MTDLAELTRAARDSFQRLGMDTIPLLPGTDRPCSEAWPTRRAPQLWWEAPLDANIGVRLGGQTGAAVFEARDDVLPGTADAILRHLAGLGYAEGDYPVVRAASQLRRQFYIRLADALDGCCGLAPGLSGTLQCGTNAYVAAPPSRVDGADYCLIAGKFERMPRLDAQDVLPMVSGLGALARHAPPPRIPHNVWRLLEGTGDGSNNGGDLDASIVLSLINAGHDNASVYDFFRQHPPPQFRAIMAESGAEAAQRWLETMYDDATVHARDQLSFGREYAQSAKEWAQQTAWPGPRRTLTVDRQVFLAHTELAYRCGRSVYSASCRELAELTGLHRNTIARANPRLRRMGLVDRERGPVGGLANLYRLGGFSDASRERTWDGERSGHDLEQTVRKLDAEAEISTVCRLVAERGGIANFESDKQVEAVVRVIRDEGGVLSFDSEQRFERLLRLLREQCALVVDPQAPPDTPFRVIPRAGGLLDVPCEIAGHDAFRTRSGLGHRCAEVWWSLLRHGPLTTRELAEIVGCKPAGARPALKRMAAIKDAVSGASLAMVVKEGKCWRAFEVDLDQVATILGAAGAGERQRKRHEAERWAYLQSNERRRAANGNA